MTETPAFTVQGDIAAAKAVVENRPTLNDAPKFIRKRMRTDSDGNATTDISDMKARAAILDLIQPSIDKRAALARTMQASIPKVVAITPRGERREVAAHLERGLGAKGFRPVVYHGHATHIERGMDGLLYRETPAGDFESMGVCCLGIPLAPCSNPKCGRCAA